MLFESESVLISRSKKILMTYLWEYCFFYCKNLISSIETSKLRLEMGTCGPHEQRWIKGYEYGLESFKYSAQKGKYCSVNISKFPGGWGADLESALKSDIQELNGSRVGRQGLRYPQECTGGAPGCWAQLMLSVCLSKSWHKTVCRGKLISGD